MVNLTCPDCGGPMTSRKNGATGERFWGCVDYPSCRGTRAGDGVDEVGPRESTSNELPSERARRNDQKRWRE